MAVDLENILTVKDLDKAEIGKLYHFADSLEEVVRSALIAPLQAKSVREYPFLNGNDGYSWFRYIYPFNGNPIRATNIQLLKWLVRGMGEMRIAGQEEPSFSVTVSSVAKLVDKSIKIRCWNDKEWHEPTLAYMGMEEDGEIL